MFFGKSVSKGLSAMMNSIFICILIVFVPHDVCTCVFARLVYLLLITEKGVSKGKISLSKS